VLSTLARMTTTKKGCKSATHRLYLDAQASSFKLQALKTRTIICLAVSTSVRKHPSYPSIYRMSVLCGLIHVRRWSQAGADPMADLINRDHRRYRSPLIHTQRRQLHSISSRCPWRKVDPKLPKSGVTVLSRAYAHPESSMIDVARGSYMLHADPSWQQQRSHVSRCAERPFATRRHDSRELMINFKL
jgi:hypothetical protein